MTSRPPSHQPGQLYIPPWPPNLLSFHDIKLHSLPISNAAQKLPGVVSLNSCLVRGKAMKKVKIASPESLSPMLGPPPNFILFTTLLVGWGWRVEQREDSQSLVREKP